MEKEEKEKKSFGVKKIVKKVAIVAGVSVAAIGGYKYMKEPEFKEKVNSGAKRVRSKVTGWFKKEEPKVAETTMTPNNNEGANNSYNGNKFGGRRDYGHNNYNYNNNN